ncbi:phage portal protein [Agrococcus sp. Marseille-Q4369]|uniref:phage portal protein n=1 Tax=Agrococcus sp. Marseille-Q4369 TaxID=2810513 RepID=UPI001B8B91A8|nr:phage portal protein [Agrococcus sp. Marseille-Q4369]QUW18885.1 phage portal protein [Agrococcus sp. Marseille-Q4369]
MSQQAVVGLTNDVLLPGWRLERARLDIIDKWWRWTPEQVKLPSRASKEAKDLRELAESPWMRLLVTTLGQQLEAELCRTSRPGANEKTVAGLWLPWQRNRMGSRQRAIHRSALAFGYAYTTVLPGDTGAVIRGRSPRDLFAVYEDAVVDEYPAYFIIVNGNRYTVVDEEAQYTLVEQDGRVQFVDFDLHDVGVAPAVRYSNEIDLEGRTPGEIEPLIKVARRIDKTTYDRLLIQHFNSWKVRTATGLERPATDTEREQQKMLLRHEDILTGGQGVTFDTLDETNLEPILKALELDVEWFAALSQTPAHAYTGKMINLSADAIEEARNTLDSKTRDRKTGFGDSHAQTLRLAAHVEGREVDAEDFSLSIQWADHGSRSLAQAADALGKVATMLGVPAEKLWDRIPTVSAEEARTWLEYKRNNPDADVQLAAALDRQIRGTDG